MTQPCINNAYENLVELNYQLYNGLFLTLPLDAVEQTGLLLPLLEEACHRGLKQGLNPTEIIEQFFSAQRPHFNEPAQIQFLFKIIQYVERQVVLIDALEDAAFSEIHQTRESNELRKLIERVEVDRLDKQFATLLTSFGARVILTAHPTQFYPGQVLAIINDLSQAIQCNDIGRARNLLQQLGNTPFFNQQKPTPLEEAVQLSWYLSNIFYPSIGKIVDALATRQASGVEINSQLLSIGFWPGGDRDGNPFVNTTTTRAVAANLRSRIVACYHKDIRALKRRLSFAGIYAQLESIERQFHLELTNQTESCFDSVQTLLDELSAIEQQLIQKHQGLFLDKLRSFQRKIRMFGFHFASLDIRQDSRVLANVVATIRTCSPQLFPANFDELDDAEQIESLLLLDGEIDLALISDPLALDTLQSLQAIKDIQSTNGELGCHRYIISNCGGARDVANLVALFRLSGWIKDQLTVDIVPLFETIKDLQKAGDSMSQLYRCKSYRQHLADRNDTQTVMLGFSDGTKDGGYLMANWCIYTAKESITTASRRANIEVTFFDGRGGPPARGGGSTYQFYAALGRTIESNQIQLTVQGQTISSYYGTQEAALHNLRQLLAAGLENSLYHRPEHELSLEQRDLLNRLARLSYEKYQQFKQHPLFLPYLEQMSTLHYYGQSNISSRPSKRGNQHKLRFEDLRAIPFVGAWSQLKQNVPGFFGLGSALKALQDQGEFGKCKALYQQSKFFKALLDNSMQSMSKTNFELTAYMGGHPTFGDFWQLINDEYRLSRELVLKVSGQTILLEDNASARSSIQLRQRVVLPLLVIQQYALMKLNSMQEQAAEANEKMSEPYEKMVIRSLFGNINASRNSA